MSSKAQFILEFTIQQGQQNSFKEQLKEIVPFIEALEPDALVYEFYFNSDESKCYVMEQYADSNAFLTHLANVNDRLQNLLKIASITRLEFFGPLSPEAHVVAESFGASFYTYFNGFSRK